MSSFPTIARDLGQILRVVSLTMAASMLITAFVGEWFALPAFAMSATHTSIPQRSMRAAYNFFLGEGR